MRKILLGTTAVAGAALFAVSTAQAQQAPTVRVGGFVSAMFNSINDNADRGTTGVSNNDFRLETEIQVFVAGKAANGLEYGAVVELQNDSGAGGTIDTDEAYVFLSSPTLGTLRIGDEDAAANLLQVRVPTISGMGLDGDWVDGLRGRTASITELVNAGSLLTSIHHGNDATKIIYLSPQFAGFDFGVSYAPNRGEAETNATGVTQRDLAAGGWENELSLALRYRGTLAGVGIAAGFGMMRADAIPSEATTRQDVSAQTVGLNLSAFGLTVGGEYTWGKYIGTSVGRLALPNGFDDSRHWSIGATYTVGAVALGAFYGVAEQDNSAAGAVTDRGQREQTIWGIGATYTAAPGLELFASYNSLKDKNIPNQIGSANNNGVAAFGTRDASVVLLGTRVAF